MTSSTLAFRGFALLLPLLGSLALHAEVNQVETLAPGVYFHEGDIKGHGHCNNGWIVFEDYVLVIDGNFPSGAKEIIPKIRAMTDKPIRFAFDTHHHGDHAYGNQTWVEQGAVPVAHTGVIEEMKKYETGYYAGKPGRWEDTAKGRPDVAASKLKPPTLLYNTDLIFDDGKHRVELLHFGVAHTHGDGFAWLPKERILFTGDACVNGPYNYVGDGDTGEWIKTLEAARKLGAEVVCPGHGPVGRPAVLEDQQAFFIELRRQVKALVDAGKQPDQIKAAVPAIKQALQKSDRIARYVGDSLAAQVEKVSVELGGQPFQPKQAIHEDHRRHAQAHAVALRTRARQP
jgi:glyoxylase-like metal-dependent hydrolase (beta-lactamase superfamily II)